MKTKISFEHFVSLIKEQKGATFMSFEYNGKPRNVTLGAQIQNAYDKHGIDKDVKKLDWVTKDGCYCLEFYSGNDITKSGTIYLNVLVNNETPTPDRPFVWKKFKLQEIKAFRLNKVDYEVDSNNEPF